MERFYVLAVNEQPMDRPIAFFNAILLFIACTTTVYAQSQQQQVENLRSFTKLYGYVRYFHPSDEVAKINWNAFAIYGADKTRHAKNVDEQVSTLKELFLPIAPSIKIFRTGENVLFETKEITPGAVKKYKTTSWQHEGVQLSNDNIYKSRRINRAEPAYKNNQPDYYPVCISLDAKQYRNKEFRFTARVRMQNSSQGSGHLWVRVDCESGQPGFFENMSNNPILHKDWETYTIKGKIDNEAKTLNFGVYLLQFGELYTDNFNVSVKNEKHEWETVYSYDFEEDKPGTFPKGLQQGINMPDRGGKKENIYGAVAFKGAASEGQIGLMIIGDPKLAKTKVENNRPLFEAKPVTGESTRQELGAGISSILPLALYCNEKGTYPFADKTALENLEKKLAATAASSSADSLPVRLAGVVITWNVFQHFFPYFEETGTNWDAALTTALNESFTDRNGDDFTLTLRRLTAKLKDGHIRVFKTDRIYDRQAPPFEWEWIENRLVITNVLSGEMGVPKGTVVNSINGTDPRRYFDSCEQYISAATPGWLQDRSKTESLEGATDTYLALNLTYPGGKTDDRIIKRTLSLQNYYKLIQPKGTISKLSEGTWLINLNNTPMEAIDSIMPELANAKTVICDLRGYPNGNHDLLCHLMTAKDTSTQWMQSGQYIYPDNKESGWRKESWIDKDMGAMISPKEPHINGRVFFLLDGGAISYAESYMSFVEHYRLATIVGQPSAGTNGNVNRISLPGGYSMTFTGMKVLKHNGSRLHGVGILPDVYVNKTIKGVTEGRDEFLEKALELAR